MADWKKWVAVNKDKLSLDDSVEYIISEMSFNEGARIATEEAVNKACELYCATCIKRHVCIKLYGYQHDKCIQYQTFKQSMKGE